MTRGAIALLGIALAGCGAVESDCVGCPPGTMCVHGACVPVEDVAAESGDGDGADAARDERGAEDAPRDEDGAEGADGDADVPADLSPEADAQAEADAPLDEPGAEDAAVDESRAEDADGDAPPDEPGAEDAPGDEPGAEDAPGDEPGAEDAPPDEVPAEDAAVDEPGAEDAPRDEFGADEADGDGDADAGADGSCVRPFAAVPGATLSGTTTGLSLTEPNEPSPCLGADGPETAYFFTLDHTADLVWSVTPVSFDAVAYVRADCDGATPDGTTIPDPVCADDRAEPATEVATWLDAVPGTYYLLVDGAYSWSAGRFSAVLSVREIVGLGAPCDGVTARCGTGLTCAAGRCVEATSACETLAEGVLTLGVPSAGDTRGGSSRLTCDGIGMADDEWWVLRADASGGTYNVRVSSTDHDLYAYSTSDCTDETMSRNCTGGYDRDVSFDVVLAPGAGTFAVVDGYLDQEGTYLIVAEEVLFLGLGEACDPAAWRTRRCPAAAYCDATGHCAAMAVESEPNDTAATADVVPAEGRVAATHAAGEFDYYAVTLAAGEILVAETLDGPTSRCEGSMQDSRIRVYDRDGLTLLAEDDDGGPGLCAIVIVSIAVAGTYYVAVDGYSASAVFDYTLRLGRAAGASTRPEVEPNDTWNTALPLGGGAFAAGAIGSATDVDYYSVAGTAARRLLVDTTDRAPDRCAGYAIDTVVSVYDTDGTTLLAEDNDSGAAYCSLAQFVFPASGTYYVAVQAYTSSVFNYTLRVLQLSP